MGINMQENLKEIDTKWKNFKFAKNEVTMVNIRNFITDEHLDIFVRYLYIKSYLENNNYKKYKDLYEKMQIKRIGTCNCENFNNLIKSFEEKGFKKEYPIPINKNSKMLNGSHRLACCLYFNINPYVVIFDEKDHDYGIKWFKENGFTKQEIKDILETKKQLEKQYAEKTIKLNNIYAAMISPLKDSIHLNSEFFINHANNLQKNGIKGLFICGNTGNGMNLKLATKKEILNQAEKLTNFSIICHVGDNNIENIYKLVDLTNKSNIACIASMPPYKNINKYFEIKKFYERLAKYSKKPLLIYHIPNITGINLKPNELIELLKINNVIGIKYTDTNMQKLKKISSENLAKYIFFGKDDYLLTGLNNDANGGIGGCYNIFPSFICKIINSRNNTISLNYQKMLNRAIKKLRNIYPTLPGGEFVLQSLKLKSNMSDEQFYEFLEDNYD